MDGCLKGLVWELNDGYSSFKGKGEVEGGVLTCNGDEMRMTW